MVVFLASAGGVLLTVGLHVAAWRIVRPKSPARLGFLCAAIALPMAYGLATFLLRPMSLPETFEWLVLCGVTAFTYVMSMPVIESDSPSFLITMLVDAKMPQGATQSDMARVITDEKFSLNRLRSLETEGLVRRTADRFEITDFGRRFLRFYTIYHVWAGRIGRGG